MGLQPGDLGSALEPEPSGGGSDLEAGALEMQAYVEMLKALTMSRNEKERHGEGVIVVVFYSSEPAKDVRMSPSECIKSRLM